MNHFALRFWHPTAALNSAILFFRALNGDGFFFGPLHGDVPIVSSAILFAIGITIDIAIGIVNGNKYSTTC